MGVQNASDDLAVGETTTTTGDPATGVNLTDAEERDNLPHPSAAGWAKSCGSELAMSVDDGEDLMVGIRRRSSRRRRWLWPMGIARRGSPGEELATKEAVLATMPRMPAATVAPHCMR